MNAIVSLYQSITGHVTQYTEDIALLLLRFMGAKVFFDSGLTKWNGWFDFNDHKYDLFLYEFFCPDPVREGALLLCDPKTLDYEERSSMITFIESMAVMAGVMEIVLPILLMVGLFTRIGALGLLGMTLFIQLAVFPTWDHWWSPAAWWAVVLFTVFAKGPGLFSLDRLVKLEKGTHQ